MKKNLRLLLAVIALPFLVEDYAMAQLPGGVPIAAWWRADAPNLYSNAGTTPVTSGEGVYQWNDYKGLGYNLVQTNAGYRPIYSNTTTLANFNPTVTFANKYMDYQPGAGVNIIDRVNGTLYAAGYTNTLNGNGFFGFDASNNYPGLHFYNDAGNYKLLFFTGGPGYQGLSSNVQKPTSFFTAGASWQNGAGSNASYAAATVSLNGTRVSYSGSQINNAIQDVNARDVRIGYDSDYGPLNGQLNEMMIFENVLTTEEMDRVETYLAIKYGTTYAAGIRDYKNSSGGVVWTSANHSGNRSNIAGIALDMNGALDQKQSWSTNAGKQILIGTTGLNNTNAANTSSLSNGQYLIWGDNGLAKSPSVALAGVSGVNYRFASIWKVQNTGSVGTVRVAWPSSGLTNLSLIQSPDSTFDSNDTPISMASNTQVINGVTYNYADVTFTDGQYFTLAASLQGPGGVVANLMMWHKANDGTSTPGTKSVWKDVSGNGRDVTQTNNAAYQPNLVTKASYAGDSKNYFFNFNPFYYFDGTNDFFYRLNDDYFPTNTSAGSTYGVMFNSAAGGWRTPYGWGDDDPNLVRGDNLYYVTRDNGTVLTQDLSLTTTPVHFAGMSWRGGGKNGIYLNTNGRVDSTGVYNIGQLNNDRNFAIGSEGVSLTSAGYELFQGGISEVFAYSSDHQNSTGDEKQRINSYLALKYGITLRKDFDTTAANYLSSSSAVVWNATTNAKYSKNIAGIANDVNSALNQRQSISVNNGQQILIGTIGLDSTNAANTSSLSNGQFLIWGDNGLAKTPANYKDSLGHGVNALFNAVWKVQNTKNVDTVRVAWPAGLTNLSLVQSTDTTFEATDRFTPMVPNTQTINGVTYNYAKAVLKNGEYFTLAALVQGGLPVSLVSFEAKVLPQEHVQVTWKTNREVNNAGYIIERSKDLQTFETVAQVRDVASASNSIRTYQIVDEKPFRGTSYYRLKQIDLNGNTTAFRPASVLVGKDGYTVYPNPVGSSAIHVQVDDPQTARVTLRTLTGTSISVDRQAKGQDELILSTTGKLTPGVYLLSVEERATTRTYKVVVN
ncbi:T9SS type A sorting domain-containing protein [Siphonobacter sp. SORGH_AS_0500]|uniref:T9SS type A sorting domain-containing protein n=1 Tax=Siphonobacter sp. SORGH_AS_0500 TaxID=1864824 RepID=UPI00285B4A2A|nr:T9SS type A sorting domain-containing protein [Siphonobacter sp. SORGH_AS_0500]MDR6196686.1 hypothetical protein [Siphonobacter sp. SORGH_AS_0500]